MDTPLSRGRVSGSIDIEKGIKQRKLNEQTMLPPCLGKMHFRTSLEGSSHPQNMPHSFFYLLIFMAFQPFSHRRVPDQAKVSGSGVKAKLAKYDILYLLFEILSQTESES